MSSPYAHTDGTGLAALALLHSLMQELEKEKVLSHAQMTKVYNQAMELLSLEPGDDRSFREAVAQLADLRNRPDMVQGGNSTQVIGVSDLPRPLR
jgi:hypothetical protein